VERGWTAYSNIDAEPSERGIDDDERLQLSDVGKLLKRSRRRIIGAARADDKVHFPRLIRDHLATDTSEIDIVSESWPSYDHVNIQAGIDAWLSGPQRSAEVLGVLNHRHHDFGLSELMQESEGPRFGQKPSNVARLNLPSGPDGQVTPCVVCGVYLVSDGEQRAVMLLRMAQNFMGRDMSTLEIAAEDPEYATRAAQEIRELAIEHNVYRGHVVSFGHNMFGDRSTVLAFHTRPAMGLDELILPESTVEAVSRQVVGVARHRQQLLASGQHLKRGLLLYGPPGVGKTHTVRYLMSQLNGVTIMLLSGNSLGNIGAACSVARTLQPAMIVVEDVDLIAEERMMHAGEHPLLFQLLNEMDGLADDADVVFLLTTNRADVLEPALAQRPGRVDQAVSLELPDEEGRRRLFRLYRGALEIDESRLDSVLERTGGVTASFLKELLRRAAVLAAEENDDPDHPGPLSVSADQLDAALDDLLETRNSMTRVLLGGQGEDRDSASTGPEFRGFARPRPGRYPGP
jgi:DNA polymerase III delta prime subunit